MRGNTRRASGTGAMPRRTISRGRQRVDRLALDRSRCPRAGRTRPRIVFIVVDLPDALPPSSDTISPSWIVVAHALQDVQVAVVGVDVLELRAAVRTAAHACASGRRGIAAEICPQHLLVAPHLVGLALGDLLAMVQHDRPCRPAWSPRPACARSAAPSARARSGLDLVGKLQRLGRVHARRRLVEQQERGRGSQARGRSRSGAGWRRRARYHLVARGVRRLPKIAEYLHRPLTRLRSSASRPRAAGRSRRSCPCRSRACWPTSDVLQHGQVGEQPQVLERAGDAASRRSREPAAR